MCALARSYIFVYTQDGMNVYLLPLATEGGVSASVSSVPSQCAAAEISSVPSECVKAEIELFQERFNHLKKVTRECLEKYGIPVEEVADVLTSISIYDFDEHKQFLQSHVSDLFRAADHCELFGIMSFTWNYLSYGLLEPLIRV